MSGNEHTICPLCGGDIKEGAIKCRHCKSMLTQDEKNDTGDYSKKSVRDVQTMYLLEEAKCPYCRNNLPKAPTRKSKCRHCENYFYVRTRVSDRQRVIVTEEQAQEIDQAWKQQGEDEYNEDVRQLQQRLADDKKTRMQRMNDPNIPDSIKDILRKQNQAIEKQDNQIEALIKAEQLAKEGRVEEAIAIAEKIMYEDGLVVRGAKWPFILSDIYLSNNMNDECWKYLNFLSIQSLDIQDKIDEIRAGILRNEGKHLEALVDKMTAGLYKYSWQIEKPENEKVMKAFRSFIIEADLIEKEDDLLILFFKYLPSIKYGPNVKIKIPDLKAFRDDFRKIIKKRG